MVPLGNVSCFLSLVFFQDLAFIAVSTSGEIFLNDNVTSLGWWKMSQDKGVSPTKLLKVLNESHNCHYISK